MIRTLHALNFIHAFIKDCSIKVFGVKFNKGVCFIREVVTALLEYIDHFIKIA